MQEPPECLTHDIAQLLMSALNRPDMLTEQETPHIAIAKTADTRGESIAYQEMHDRWWDRSITMSLFFTLKRLGVLSDRVIDRVIIDVAYAMRERAI